jgi:hypothetical protein
MGKAIVVTVQVDDAEVAGEDDSYAVASGATVTLVATAESDLTDVKWHTVANGQNTEFSPDSTSNDPLTTANATFVAGDTETTYTVTAKVKQSTGDPVEGEANTVTLLPKLKESVPAPGGVVEPNVGEFDPKFSAWTFAVVAVFSLLVLIGIAILITNIELPGKGAVVGKYAPNGTWAERAATVITFIALGVGVITLLLGVWLAAIETRGRLRNMALIQAATAPGSERGLGADQLKAVSEVLDSASKMRGAIAVLVAGTAIILGSMWAGYGTATTAEPPATSVTP